MPLRMALRHLQRWWTPWISHALLPSPLCTRYVLSTAAQSLLRMLQVAVQSTTRILDMMRLVGFQLDL